jgi:divalent metal cation (Fe/Co/Zn/Cd) transporter
VDEQKYPVGRSRLEPIGIIVCASLMGIAALQLIFDSLVTLWQGTLGGVDPATLVPNVDRNTVFLLSAAIGIKVVLFLICNSARDQSDSMMVLAEDHRNDVVSNGMALITAWVAKGYAGFWWMDPLGGVSIASYICVMWFFVAQEQAGMLEGVAAEPVFLEEVRKLADNFHPSMYADVVRGYHFGKRYLVEVEVVLPGNMTVVDAHDISLELQKKIERMEQVERAFVHVDYQTRDENEHKASGYESPSSGHSRATEDDNASDTSSAELHEEVKVLTEVYAGSGAPTPIAVSRHVHVVHHAHASREAGHRGHSHDGAHGHAHAQDQRRADPQHRDLRTGRVEPKSYGSMA